MSDPISSGPLGAIMVRVGSDSMFLGQALPIEVRNSELRLVAKATSAREIKLPEGLYEVSAVLEDGRKHSSLVQVKGGEQTPVNIASLQGVAAGSGGATADLAVTRPEDPSVYRRPRFTRSMANAAGTERETGVENAADSSLVEVQGATLVRETRTLRIFQSLPTIDRVPSALLQIGSRRVRISLPVSPTGWTPSGSCAVRVECNATGTHVQAWIAPERTVANALQNMLSAGFVLEAAKVADDAVELLREKYQDPAGAVLGGLILLKTGGLKRWSSWVENLARDFVWLPDGKVLLAQLMVERESASERALALALEASQQRMLYTECHSLLLDLLRRWPRDEARDARQEAIRRLTDYTPDVDWESICLCHALPGWEG